jgi:sugar phosphate isomerase/epimerase
MATVLAAQTYTVRDFMKTPADYVKTLTRLREIGYEAIQIAMPAIIPTDELSALLKKLGLSVCATHIGFERMRDDPKAVIAEHKAIGCPNTAIGGMPGAYRNKDGYSKFAKEASQAAKALVEGGLTWSYHNHSFELQKFDGRSGLSILVKECDPKYVNFEVDTYWITHGGGDPAQWIRSLKGRIPLVHFKDMVMGEKEQLMAEVGEGNLNWPGILEACREAGVKWHIVEQDTCQRDPFESLAISLKNLKAMGLK